MDENGYLVEVTERTHIEKKGERAAFTEDDGASWTELPMDAVVSMNMWGLHPEFFEVLEKGFREFLSKVEENSLKAEYLLPTIVGDLLADGSADVKVLRSHDKWFGVTYKEDKAAVVASVRALVDGGVYPEKLF